MLTADSRTVVLEYLIFIFNTCIDLKITNAGVFSAQEDMDCSPGSPLSAGSPLEQAHASDNPTRVLPANEGTSKQSLNADLSPFPGPKPEPEPEAVRATDIQPELKTPAVLEVKKAAAGTTLPVVDEVPFRPSISLDTILNQEIHSLTSAIKNIMQTNHICYTSQLPPRLVPRGCWLPNSCFSDFIVPFVSPVPTQGHVKALCDMMDKLIPAPPAPSKATSPPPPVTTSNLTTPPPAPIQTSKTKAEPPLSKSTPSSQSDKIGSVKELASTKTKTEVASTELAGEVYSPCLTTTDSPDANSQNPSLLAGSLIGQLKPEVFSSLVEIFKDVTKNTVKFYIHSGDEGEESTVGKEIKVKV